MTTLAIMATYEKKRLKCYGTVAAGEHVAVTVTDGAQWIGEGKALRLRVLFGPDTVGVFPFADGDAWTATGTQNADAACELNLNTLQAEKYLKHGGTCLWILDDVENHTLYATGEFDVLPWPKRRGIDEPIDLDGYPLLLDEIKDLKEAFEEYQRTVAQMLATKQDTIFDLATIRSGAAAGATAVQPSQIARFVDNAEYKAQYGEQNKPAILFKHGTNVIVALDATPFVKDGMVSSVAVVGGNLVITFNTDSGKQPITVPLTDIFDPDNYYDKDAVDNLLDNKQNALTFDNAPTSGSNNPVKSGGIWSAIWGALTALPTGFASLYDWCVAQIAKLRDKLDLNVYSRGNALVTFPDGFSVTYMDDTYVASSGGETIEFYGPITSTAVPQYNFWVPYNYKDKTDFDPQEQAVWCLFGDIGNSTPNSLMYRTGASYDIANWNTEAPTLTLSNGEATGGEPTMTRPLGATGDTLAKASQLDEKLDKSGGTVTGSISMLNGILDAGDVQTHTYFDFNKPGETPKSLDSPQNSGKALTDADISDSSSTLGAAFAGKQPALSAQQLANIAAVSDALAFDATHSYSAGDPVVYNGTLYTFTAAHTGAWTGSDVSAVDIIARLAGKANENAVVKLTGDQTISGVKSFYSGITMANGADIDFSQGGRVIIRSTSGSVAVLNHDGIDYSTDGGFNYVHFDWPSASGTFALTSDLLAKLNSTSAAPAFSTSSTYAVGDHVTYNGALYRCTTAVTTAGAWTGSTNWTAEDMTTPDATLDVTATDKLLRLVATNGDIIWSQGYNLSTTSSATVITEQVGAFTFAADAAADQAIVLPSVAAGKVGDFILDVTNLSANDRSLTLTGLDSAFSVVVKAGDDLSETLTVAAGEMARYYFTMTAFRVNSLPTWQVAKEAVENGGAQS